MKYLLQTIAGLGGIIFVVGFVIRLMDTGQLLHASAVGWWRASIAVLTIGMLLALIEILGELRREKTVS